MKNGYIGWLKNKGEKLFYGGGHYWRIYQNALIPASPFPVYIDNMDESDCRRLLKESGALFLRYASNKGLSDGQWWYVVCYEYSQQKVSSKMRNQIKRAYKNCRTEKLSCSYLAENGYECYVAAYQRYKYAVPASYESFYQNIMGASDEELFDYWGVFVGNRLVGYCQCIVEENQVATSVIKYDPEYLKYYSSYALMDTILSYYVKERAMVLSNGSRSISHDTNIQEYLLKFGFQKEYCMLNVFYAPLMEIAIKLFYPIRGFLKYMPEVNFMHKVDAILYQEDLRRKQNVSVV